MTSPDNWLQVAYARITEDPGDRANGPGGGRLVGVDMADSTDAAAAGEEANRPLPFTTPGRVAIACYCWIRKPDTELRCTLAPHASGVHFHAYTRSTWPHRGPEPQ